MGGWMGQVQEGGRINQVPGTKTGTGMNTYFLAFIPRRESFLFIANKLSTIPNHFISNALPGPLIRLAQLLFTLKHTSLRAPFVWLQGRGSASPVNR